VCSERRPGHPTAVGGITLFENGVSVSYGAHVIAVVAARGDQGRRGGPSRCRFGDRVDPEANANDHGSGPERKPIVTRGSTSCL